MQSTLESFSKVQGRSAENVPTKNVTTAAESSTRKTAPSTSAVSTVKTQSSAKSEFSDKIVAKKIAKSAALSMSSTKKVINVDELPPTGLPQKKPPRSPGQWSSNGVRDFNFLAHLSQSFLVGFLPNL